MTKFVCIEKQIKIIWCKNIEAYFYKAAILLLDKTTLNDRNNRLSMIFHPKSIKGFLCMKDRHNLIILVLFYLVFINNKARLYSVINIER